MKNERLKRRGNKHYLEQAVWWLNHPDAKWSDIRKRLEVLYPGANFTIDSISGRAKLRKAIRIDPCRLVKQFERLCGIADATDVQRDRLRPIGTRTRIVMPIFMSGEYIRESTVTPTLEYWVDRIAAILTDRQTRWRVRRCAISQCGEYFVIDRRRRQPPATCSTDCATALAKEKRRHRPQHDNEVSRKLAMTNAKQSSLNIFALIPIPR